MSKRVGQASTVTPPDRALLNLQHKSKNNRVSIGGGRTQSALAMVDGVNNTRGGLGV